MSSPFGTETVLDVRHWTDAYFSFTTTRDDGFRFDNGQFVMIGLEVEQPDGSRRPGIFGSVVFWKVMAQGSGRGGNKRKPLMALPKFA